MLREYSTIEGTKSSPFATMPTTEISQSVSGDHAASPASSGPAGPLFEGMVGAHYLLSLLAGGEPRGLPGAIPAKVEYQRASDARPLDDVIVHAVDARGTPAILEIQAKRAMTFSASDETFQSVVAQVAKAGMRAEFDTTRYELAVALERTSTKIERSLQIVLSWARALTTAEIFFIHLNRSGFASDEMRSFVDVFRANLRLVGVAHDDGAVWRLLQRFQILVFDFNQPGSASELLARERASMLLIPDDTARGGELWSALVQLNLQSAASAGEYTAASLRDSLISMYAFHFAGDRKLRLAREVLLEASQAALHDVNDRVGQVHIDRAVLVSAVRAALDVGRYVEIRGDAGVGKSGVMRQLAEQIGREARTLVLSPDRTPEQGWMTLQSTIGCQASATEFLSDLASNGGAMLFIDGVDFFDNEAKRVTVRDLVRAAAQVQNFFVVVTARSNFGIENPSWLPEDAIEKLGSAPPISITELDTDEIAQLREGDASLAELLVDAHPAREVVRNLFRLARLATRPRDQAVPRTEAEMGRDWWQSGGGGPEARRERCRVLRAVTAHAITSIEPADVSGVLGPVVEQLKMNGSLRELQPDKVVFQHDVLREWAIGCLLLEEPQHLVKLPLSQPAPAPLVRGVEIAARLSAEISATGQEWSDFVTQLSTAGVHGSWRRAAVLAIVRSELGQNLFDRVAPILVAANGTMLSDLVRMVIAVESKPAASMLAEIGMDAKTIPEDFVFPVARSWSRLVIWTLRAIAEIPKPAIPDLINLYSRWCMGTLGADALTPHLVRQLFMWLEEVESAHYATDFRSYRRPFDLDLDSTQARDLEGELRTSFLLFCSRTPDLAQQYLQSVAGRRGGERIAESILKFRGTAAQAAPEALTDLTLATLIPVKKEEEDVFSSRHNEMGPFDHHDISFMPASPVQGPFFDLLIHAPNEGLRLVRALVDHGVSYYTEGRECGEDKLVIPFPMGDREFPWTDSYIWARDGNSYVITSALMALEAWGHRCIEAGEPFHDVMAKVLGTGSTPAAFLLVAVDLFISHWPITKDDGWPFLACPELLVLDHTRATRDNMRVNQIDFMDAATLQKEPAGQVKLADLRRRASRGTSLDHLIGNYVFHGEADLLAVLRARIAEAALRVGPPDAENPGMGNVRFTAAHAVNLANANNWQDEISKRADGTEVIGHRYHAPPAEREMLEPAAAESNAKLAETQLMLALAAALDDREKSSPELVNAGMAWTQDLESNLSGSDDGDGYLPEWRARTRVIVAALVMRDGDVALKNLNAQWATDIFSDVLAHFDDRMHRHQTALSMSAVAAAGIGRVGLLCLERTEARLRAVLEIAALPAPSMAFVFVAESHTINTMDERLVRSLLRVAFSACIHVKRGYDESETDLAIRREQNKARIRAAIDADIAWLGGTGSEPAWPDFPLDDLPRLKPRRSLRVLGGAHVDEESIPDDNWKKPGHFTDSQCAARWLWAMKPLVNTTTLLWVRQLINVYAGWTAVANGVGLGEETDSVVAMMEWNGAYYAVLAASMTGLAPSEIDAYALKRIYALPDEPFFDVSSGFIRCVDALYFNQNEITVDEAIRIRTTLAKRLMKSRRWNYLVERNSASIEWHRGPAIASLFMHEHSMIKRAQCYLLAKGAERLAPYMPMLTDIAVTGARSAFVAILFLGLVEVKVQAAHLQYVARAGTAWLAVYAGDTAFWVDLGVGRRLCAWFDEAMRVEPTILLADNRSMLVVDTLLDGMVRAGVVQARATEEQIARFRQSVTPR